MVPLEREREREREREYVTGATLLQLGIIQTIAVSRYFDCQQPVTEC